MQVAVKSQVVEIAGNGKRRQWKSQVLENAVVENAGNRQIAGNGNFFAGNRSIKIITQLKNLVRIAQFTPPVYVCDQCYVA